MKTKICIAIACLFLSAVGYGMYLYNKPHKNILEAKAEIRTSAQSLISDFSTHPNHSTSLINKVLEISGKITLIEKSDESIVAILDDGIKCEIDLQLASFLKKGNVITIKGVYSGFDDMFNEISLVRCQLIQ